MSSQINPLTLVTNPTLFTAPVPLYVVLGSGFNYTPLYNQAALVGQQLYNATNANLVVHTFQSSSVAHYRFTLDPTAGDFLFGEILFKDNQGVTLMVGTLQSLVAKKQQTALAGSGNTLYMDIFLDLSSGGVQPFGQLLNSNNGISADYYPGVELLPSPQYAQGNIALVAMPITSGNNGQAEPDSMMCYVSSDALFRSWAFDKYVRVCSGYIKAVSGTSLVLNLSIPLLPPSVNASTTGPQYLIQFENSNYPVRICSVQNSTYNSQPANFVNLSYNASATVSALMAEAPVANDPTTIKYKLYQLSTLSAQVAAFFAGISATSAQLNAAAAMTSVDYIKADGTVPMAAPLNMANNQINMLGAPLLTTDAATMAFATSASGSGSAQTQALTNAVKAVTSTALLRNGSVPMSNSLNAGMHPIINTSPGVNGSDVATVAQLNTAMPQGTIIMWETAVPVPTGWGFVASASFAPGFELIKKL